MSKATVLQEMVTNFAVFHTSWYNGLRAQRKSD